MILLNTILLGILQENNNTDFVLVSLVVERKGIWTSKRTRIHWNARNKASMANRKVLKRGNRGYKEWTRLDESLDDGQLYEIEGWATRSGGF